MTTQRRPITVREVFSLAEAALEDRNYPLAEMVLRTIRRLMVSGVIRTSGGTYSFITNQFLIRPVDFVNTMIMATMGQENPRFLEKGIARESLLMIANDVGENLTLDNAPGRTF